ncbi:MAG: restriction endonuclease subunit S [Gammaproteobacteria bacterium]
MSNLPNFDTVSIEDATDRLIDYRGKTPPKANSGVRLVTAKVVKGGQILDEPAEFIATDFYDEWMRRGLPRKLDVLLTTEAPLGEVAVLRDNEKIALAQRIILLRAKSGHVDPLFLFYALQSDYGQSELKARASGTTVLGIKQSELRQVRIPIFPLPVQQRIASILSAYDELIENCQKRIRILETMARALYREWFVQFRFPGNEKVPLVNSPIGNIPEGWAVKKLGDILKLNYGKALKKEERYGGQFPVFGSSGIVGYHNASLVNGPGIIVGRKGNIGSVFWCDDDFFVIDTAYFVTSTTPLRYLFYVLPTLNFINSDAAVPGLSRNQAYTLEIVVPPAALLKRFSEMAETFQRQASTLLGQINNLRRTRDLLLPRLLSEHVKLENQESKG